MFSPADVPCSNIVITEAIISIYVKGRSFSIIVDIAVVGIF